MLITTKSDAYKKAFAQYLRKGTPIHYSLKKEQPKTGFYIWHTVGDDKVRSRHAERDGRIFSWDNPPEGGHPGEDYGCRCWAEPYEEPHWVMDRISRMPGAAEAAIDGIAALGRQGTTDLVNVLSGATTPLDYFDTILRRGGKWKTAHFIAHYYRSNGRAVTLQEIGHLEDIIAEYRRKYLYRFIQQISCRASQVADGYFVDTFERAYNFEKVSYSHGDVALRGRFSGVVKTNDVGERRYQGVADIIFDDVFTDPLSIVEILADALPFVEQDDIPSWIRNHAEMGGTKYDITGTWTEEISGVANAASC